MAGPAALLMRTSSEELSLVNGKVAFTMELALKHGFMDSSGKLPDGPFSSEEPASGMRAALDNTPFQYNLKAPMPDPKETNSKEAAGLFPGA